MNSCTALLRRLYERHITSTSFNSIQFNSIPQLNSWFVVYTACSYNNNNDINNNNNDNNDNNNDDDINYNNNDNDNNNNSSDINYNYI